MGSTITQLVTILVVLFTVLQSTQINAGKAAVPHWSPWQAGVFHRNGQFLCGGSIISRIWIITAAKCLYNKNLGRWLNADEFIIRTGDHFQRISDKQNYTACNYYYPPQYNPEVNLGYDIALVKLTDAIDVYSNSPTVRTIFLPSEPVSIGSVCATSGWSKTELESSPALVLKYVNMRVQNLTASDDLNRPMFRARNKVAWLGNGPCLGKTAGPFICQNSYTKNWVLQGIISHLGVQKCNPKIATAFVTDVHQMRTWITDIIGKFTYPLCS